MLSMWHTHGSAPWSTHLSRQVLAQWEHSEQENELSIYIYEKVRWRTWLQGIYLFVGSLFCVGGYRVHTEVLHYNMNMGEEGDWVTNVATVCLEDR